MVYWAVSLLLGMNVLYIRAWSYKEYTLGTQPVRTLWFLSWTKQKASHWDAIQSTRVTGDTKYSL